MKLVILLMITSLILSSCFTHKSLTKKGEPITEDIKTKIQPGKMHFITLKYGERLKVHVTSIDSIKIYGTLHAKNDQGNSIESPFEDTFENLKNNAVKIEVRKINPALTGLVVLTTLIMIPVIIEGPFAYD